MNFINVLQKGDFIKLRTIAQLKAIGWEISDESSIRGGLTAKMGENIVFIEPNAKRFLGEVVRVSKVTNSETSTDVFIHAKCNGIGFSYYDGNDIVFEDMLVDSVLINGTWYHAGDDVNKLYCE